MTTKLEPGQIKKLGLRGTPDTKSLRRLKSLVYPEAKLKAFIRLATYVEKNCSDFVKIMKDSNEFLYRGIKDANKEDHFFGVPRENRYPRDTSQENQELADEYLTLAGFKALRRNSIFCTSKYGNALSFTKLSDASQIYTIFPLNGFDYTWSIKHKDWVIQNPELKKNTQLMEIHKIWNNITWHSLGYESSMIELRKSLDIWDSLRATMPGLSAILETDSVHQLKIWCDQALDKNVASKIFIKNNQIVQERLDTALKMEHEILIHGPYVAINYVRYKYALHLYFFNWLPDEDK